MHAQEGAPDKTPEPTQHQTADQAADHAATPTESAPPVCPPDGEIVAWIDRLHSNLFRLTCSTASWFDGLFGDRRYDQEYRATNGKLTVGSLWSERDGFNKILRFHARLYLPQLSKRFHAFIGRVDPQEFISESKQEVYGLPSAFGRNLDDSTLLGLGYSEPLTKNGSFDADTGVHLQFPLDPYVRGSYRFARPVGARNLFRLRETVFWENTEKLGTTTRLDWDRVITDNHLLRWTGSGTFSERTQGMRWYSTLTLYQVLSLPKQRALAYELAASGSTDAPEPLGDYGATIIYRQSIWRDWLMLEARAGVDWPRDVPSAPRTPNPNGGLAFELRYGNPDGGSH